MFNRKRCSVCGAWISHKLLICPICGQHWEPHKQAQICHTCGARVAPDKGICPYCGEQLRATARRLSQPLGQTLLRLSRFVASIAIVALAAWLVWGFWSIVTEVGETDADGVTIRATEPLSSTAVSQTLALSAPLEAAPPSSVVSITPAPEVAMAFATASIMEESADLAVAEEPTPLPATLTATLMLMEPSPTATPVPAGPRIHIVEKGDTLTGLAVRYNVTSKEIAQANGISLDAILSIGQELIIPGGQPSSESTTSSVVMEAPSTSMPLATLTPTYLTHRIQPGEHLGILSKMYGVSMADIAAANQISVSAILQVGQELRIPIIVTPLPGQSAAETSPVETPLTPVVQRTSHPTETPTPTPKVLRHVVQKGDTLGAIAVQYQVSSEEIAAANGISLNAILRIGQELVIPGSPVEPTPAATTTPEATLTPTSTLTPTPTPFPIQTPVRGLPYAAPWLLTPANGTIFRGSQNPPVLQWASVGILKDDEWYRVQVWAPQQQGVPTEAFTKATFWRVPRELYPGGRREQRFEWQVAVVRLLDAEPRQLLLSLPSEIYSFVWR